METYLDIYIKYHYTGLIKDAEGYNDQQEIGINHHITLSISDLLVRPGTCENATTLVICKN